MSKFQFLNIVAAILLLVFISTGLWNFWPIFILSLVYLLALGAGSFLIRWNFYLKALHKAETGVAQIALTFDDGPDPETTNKILEILSNHNAKATFFCIGRKVEEHPELVKLIHQYGHIIGNHGYSHATSSGFLSTRKIKEEIFKTTEQISGAIGKKPLFFRPPFGITNPSIALAVKQQNMIPIGWSLRSLDTVKTAQNVLKRLKNVQAGNIVLLHDNRPQTAEILEEYLFWLKKQEIKVVPLDRILNINAYED